ncbi:uncharacterized protein YfaS (alpha-2-macroglobulin family) [Ereboglobus sp. PH5-10]|uniref:alpha-2-macroglobulin family protein n=1 Tax=Ereboglobus sp. PH5-10 TaxID=2940629 RepID=UPI002406C885|nr:alpha-2-macroglobulin family protein [Ereboglobus sp. PH5-10]MDF9826355.1 uncharacterized protein YfaS (alpha-2-macroglobulin family) [Ereboglobus sp. PH5-10]
MKRNLPLVLALLLSLFTLHPSLFAADRAADWRAVADAQKAGQPKTASAALDKIITGAIADEAWPEAVRAILIKAQADAANVDRRGQPAARIRSLTAWLADDHAPALPASMRPLLEAALAKTWWNYYQQNRWQLLQRTQTAEQPSDDFRTWDARRVLAETARHFEAALADPVVLQKTPIAKLEPLLAKGNLPDDYRPTLYDFLVHEAIAFYSAGEQGVAKSENTFEPTPDSPILGSLEEFLAWNPESGTSSPPVKSELGQVARTTQPVLRAIQLYQQLLRFHLDDPLPQLALADIEHSRLNWAARILGSPAQDRYFAALRDFIERASPAEPSVATAAALTLAQLRQHDAPDEAVAIAQAAVNNDANSLNKSAFNSLRNIIVRIKAGSLQSITTESTWPISDDATAPFISVQYRNLKKVYFRAYEVDQNALIKSQNSIFMSANWDQFKDRKIAKSWNANLPATPDYRYRDEKLPAPRDLKPGLYLIAASPDKNFSEEKNVITTATVWVSDLAIIHNGYNRLDGNVSGFVVNAITGDPVPAATVSAAFDGENENYHVEKTTANEDGFFLLTDNRAKSPRHNRLRVIHAIAPDGRVIAVSSNDYGYANHPPAGNEHTRIYFFTDRSIYRPGQSINFKAVAMRAIPKKGNYSLLTNHRLTIVLSDPNSKEAGKLELVTNGFGSVSGSFTVPAGRLTGYYRLHSQTNEIGDTSVNVEEYKRPKFEVTLPAPEIAPKLNDTVTLAGAAVSYTGAPIDGAKVTWRVQRLIRWPRWCWWTDFLPNQPHAIAHGTATTDASGKFTLEFTALPDPVADAKNEPVFAYSVTAEVTDTTGETRTASRTVSVGYTAIAADITIEGDWLTDQAPVALKLATTTLDGAPQSATGQIAFHALTQPASVPQPEAQKGRYYYHRASSEYSTIDPTSPDPQKWPAEKDALAIQAFTTDSKTGLAKITQKLPAGIYRAIVTTQDRFGKPVTAQTEIRVLAPEAPRHPIKEPISLAAPNWTAQPGDTLTALWSSGYDTARAHISIEQDGETLRAFWTKPNASQQHIPIEITESMRGGITLNIVQVRDNRLVTKTRRIDIPWGNKKLKISWEHFNSKLVPGGRETWTAKITSPDATTVAAEFAAALYDASLDQYRPHNWPSTIAPFRFESGYYRNWSISNRGIEFDDVIYSIKLKYHRINHGSQYRHWGISFNTNDIIKLDRYVVTDEESSGVMQQRAASSYIEAVSVDNFGEISNKTVGEFMKYMPGVTLDLSDEEASFIRVGGLDPKHAAFSVDGIPLSPAPDLTAVTARKNLNETAFFFPQLLTDSDGSVRMEFTVPEALTRWKFLGFAHDKQLRSAILTDTAVTAKDLMVQPNPPRFLREGDTVEFTVKVTNMTDKPQTGSAQLSFADASSLEAVNLFTGSTVNSEQKPVNFSLGANRSQTLSWRITIPDGQGFLTYKAVASTGAVSDGEEGFLPVLSRRQLVTESITLPVRDKGTYTFRFPKLAESETSALQSFSPSALRHESLTVQMTGNPAWYAVLALPNLMEYPHECTEQLFNRYYANALAAHIANSDPKIARVFEQWRNTPALESPLLKNEDLKSVLIEETPWLRDATRESENRRAIGNLFDANRTAAQTQAIIAQLAERQMNDGLWAWFPGGRGSDYITRYLVAGFARLRHFGIPLDNRADTMLKRAVTALDAALAKHHAELIATENFNPDGNHIRSADAFQLYTRSFYLKQIPIPDTARAAYDFYTAQARKHWLSLPRQSQGHAALALARMGDTATPAAIVTSLKQHAQNHDELGMYWADTNRGWFWWQAPIETQALMIEVFDEVARDTQAVSDLQLWLLKQKQTQAWPSTKATADAVYALLLRGADKLASDALVTVSLGGKKIEPAQSEAGTGYYRERIPGPSITPSMGEKITVTKTDAGPAWGGVTWQYLQTIDKITPHEGTPLTLKKTLWKQINTSSGPTLVALDKTKLEPGDTLIARIELRTDRDMEFVHLKDQRGSGTEPVNVLSGYRWKNGLGYYESTRDTATHFFMDWLPAGTHVFEYPVRVQLRGVYESGIAEIQCMYAPEYNSHSASTTLVVE